MEEFEIEVKRFYVPVVIKEPCPKCGSIVEHDYSMDYLSYPTANKVEEQYMYCDDCDHEFNVEIILKVSLEKVEK